MYPTSCIFPQGDKPSRAQILKKASEYIAFMRRKNASHANDIEDLKRQNQQLESQVPYLRINNCVER
jgi:Max protein